MLKIKGYLPTSLIEWPGKISAVLFLPVCNFRCLFCHNRDLVLDSKNLDLISEEKILSDLKKRKKWIDGVSITGGEPTLHGEFLINFFQKTKDLGFANMIQTNGTGPNILEKLFERKLIDYLSMDVKAPFDNRYKKIIDREVDFDTLAQSLQLIKESGIGYEFRTTVVPGLLDKEDLLDIARVIPWAEKWFLQQFVPRNTLDETYMEIKPYSEEKMKEFLKELRKIVSGVQLRGV